MAVSAIKTTEIQVVNKILSAIGEPPITALGGTDSIQAEAILQEVFIDVQSQGWLWNTRSHTFTADGSGNYVIADAYIFLDTAQLDSRNYTIRNNFIFDLANNTNVFTVGATLTFTIVELLSWVSLPETARQYIGKKAARVYLQRYLPDNSTARGAAQDEMEALVRLQREELSSGNYSIFQRSNLGYPTNIVGRSL